MRNLWTQIPLLAGLLLAPGGAALAAPAPAVPSPEDLRFFESRIRPILVDRCQKCHGPEQQSGKLRLDTPEALRRGGGRGPGVVPGEPARSLLLAAVRHAPDAPKMPPDRRLAEREIADLARWIEIGAPWPAARAAAAAPGSGSGRHWAFRPVREPKLPAVRNRAWVRNPIDAFILARLETKGLKPAPPADRRTLIRRATFDLTGLPPTPEEIAAFVMDRSPNAWEKVVERLLASPAYGERWGRHWLDVARYADSNGLDENVHYGNAWRYRDYVIRSFNEDRPYDRFLREQIAGDLLPGSADEAERRERLIATGFLAIGPKVISEVDDRKLEMDLIDEQVDTVGRTVMGLTLGCARCHDHKFDPLSTRDYYALAGIFKSTRTMSVMKKPRMWFEHSIATAADRARLAEHEAKVAALKERIARQAAEATERLRAALPAGAALPKNPESAFPAEAKESLARLREELARLEKEAPPMPMAMGVTEGEVGDLPVHVRGSFLTLGDVVPRRFPAVLAGTAQPRLAGGQSGRLQLAEWLVSPSHPLTSRVMANRIWRWHFGQGLVRTTDNFGLLGEAPSNPELLDWLARRFVEGGWSMKRMHRLIMGSSTYRMSDAADARALRVDPENRLHWRWSLRRLEAEAIRDALLAVSGTLDRTMGGTIIPLKNREYFFDHTSRDTTQYDSRRRSLYLPVVRNHLYDVFQLFDFGDASVPEGSRPTTTVAPQALFMLNSDLVMDAAEHLAVRIARNGSGPEERLRRLYLLAYGRRPTGAEAARDRSLLARFERSAEGSAPEREKRAWAWLCQVTLAANEFLFVR